LKTETDPDPDDIKTMPIHTTDDSNIDSALSRNSTEPQNPLKVKNEFDPQSSICVQIR
jgi:hypothetical protein